MDIRREIPNGSVRCGEDVFCRILPIFLTVMMLRLLENFGSTVEIVRTGLKSEHSHAMIWPHNRFTRFITPTSRGSE